tara:strand:- start:313 stop:522 length:210 start_codon:yes stop_codon:yes gene_type:complete
MKKNKLEELMMLSFIKDGIKKQSKFFKKNSIKEYRDGKFHNYISKHKQSIPTDKNGFIDFEKLDNNDEK